MTPRACAALLVKVVALLSWCLPAGAAPPAPSGEGAGAERAIATAFFYERDVPHELLAHYDRVVVEPDHYEAMPTSPRAEVFAYVSLGEVNPSRPWHRDVPRHLVLGKNKAWGTEIIDTRRSDWASFVVERVIEPLWRKGYRGFFFDTLDSYESVAKDAAEREAHARGIGVILSAIAKRHPEAKLVLNRGFDVLPWAPRVHGFVAESLFATCDAQMRKCGAVPPAESDALARRLAEVKARHRVPISVIDYAPSRDLAARRAIAERISALGFDPWVSTPKLDEIGTGAIEIVPRRVLMLYKSNDEGYLGVQDAAVLVAPILEWLGYAVDYADVRQPLPSASLVGRYAGVVTLLPEGVDNKHSYRQWLLDQVHAGVKVAFVEGFGFEPDAEFLAELGLAVPKAQAKPPMRVTKTTPYFGFEAPVRPHVRERPQAFASRPDVRSLLRVEDSAGGVWDGAVVGPWGGAAFIPYVIEERLEQERRWLMDPFAFLKDALALPPIPAPDVTTEAGRRIFTVHIDGDAIVSRVERRDTPFTGEVLLKEVLKNPKYRTPTTVSIVEGEVSPAGMYPHLTAKLEPIARQIFALPHVEMASHTFSHPFEWEDAEAGKREPHVPHLPIKGYAFDLQRELKGSVDYINTLAPPGKKVRVMLWSGSCSPSANAVGLTQKLGLFNVNGGGATRTTDLPSLTRGSAMGVPKAPGVYQVFAPVENENVYTNDWLGPFDGYRHAIETFKLGDSPRRMQILTIYYHFYSAAKTAALVALEEVYDWAMQQETTPLYLSEYAAKVVSFQRASLARRPDGRWELGNLGELRTVRLDPALGWPDVGASTGVAGVRNAPQGRYVHLTDDRERGAAVLALSDAPQAAPRIVHANGRVRSWRAGPGGKVKLRVAGNVPLEIEVSARGACTLRAGDKPEKKKVTEGAGKVTTRFSLTRADTGEAELECQ